MHDLPQPRRQRLQQVLLNTSADISADDISHGNSSDLSESLELSRGTSAPHWSVEQRRDEIDGENSFISDARIEGDEDCVNSDLDLSHLVSSNPIFIGTKIDPLST